MQLQEFLQKIEQESTQKCAALKQQADAKMETDYQQTMKQIKAKEISEQHRIENQENVAYEKRMAALKQDFRKQELRLRQSKISDAVGYVRQRLAACTQSEFESFLLAGLQTLRGQGEYVITFGDQSPVDVWQSWIAHFMTAEGTVRFSQERLHDEVGFMIEQGKVAYRLLASEIDDQLMRDKGAELNRMLFEQEGRE